MKQDPVNILIIDDNKEFYSFLSHCINDQEKEEFIEVLYCEGYNNAIIDDSIDFFVILSLLSSYFPQYGFTNNKRLKNIGFD